ncbi:unnamed protein product (mitochondrion) [Musa hybrid cultivar]
MIQRTRNLSAILTLKPTPPISFRLLQQYRISVPYLDAYSSICFPVMARRNTALDSDYCGVLFLNGIIATRGKAMLPTLPQRGALLNASYTIRAQQA